MSRVSIHNINIEQEENVKKERKNEGAVCVKV